MRRILPIVSDKELYKAIECLRGQVEVLIQQQEKQNKRILLTHHQRIQVAAKAKRQLENAGAMCSALYA